MDVWSQLIMKETAEGVDLLTAAPRTGVYTIAPDGSADFRRHAYDWHGIVDESEAFYLRILAPGDFRYKGADLGAIVTAGGCRPTTTRWSGAASSGSAASAASSPGRPWSRSSRSRQSASRSRWPDAAASAPAQARPKPGLA